MGILLISPLFQLCLRIVPTWFLPIMTEGELRYTKRTICEAGVLRNILFEERSQLIRHGYHKDAKYSNLSDGPVFIGQIKPWIRRRGMVDGSLYTIQCG